MRRISTIWLALLVTAGCSGGSGDGTNPVGNHVGDQPSPPARPAAPGFGRSACEEPCEGPTLMYKKISGQDGITLHLTPQETDGLKEALKNTPVIGPAESLYIRADARDGQLTFSAERVQNLTQLTGNEPLISIGIPNSPHSSLPVRILATPAGTKLLDQKAASPSR